MAIRKEMAITIVLVVLAALVVLGLRFDWGTFENSDAKKFVLEDLHSQFPHANKIEIINYETRSGPSGQYYAIKASVSEGLDTPCPKRTHYYYNYPQQNFVPAPPEYIVNDCSVCENKPCILAFVEEAIVASHTLPGTDAVDVFISSRNATPTVSKPEKGWEVTWTAPEGDSSYVVLVSENGYVISVERK